MKNDTKKTVIHVSLAFGLLLLIFCCIAQTIFMFNDRDDVSAVEPELNYTIGRCVEWNNTFTEIDIYGCEDFEDEDIRCEVFLGDNHSAKIEVRNQTCLNELYSKGFDGYNYTEYENCFLLEQETHPCTARMITVNEW